MTYGAEWREIRRRVLERDDHECQSCTRDDGQNGIGLEVHHLTPRRYFSPPSKGDRMENLITLCARCHGRVEAGKCPDSEPDIRDDTPLY